jgi:hypothetical protein
METMRYKAAIIPLGVISCVIILLGAGFTVYAFLNNVTFHVLSADIPGFIFSAVVVYLGIRYFLSTVKMAKNIKGKSFSWKNFGGTAK